MSAFTFKNQPINSLLIYSIQNCKYTNHWVDVLNTACVKGITSTFEYF